MIKFYSACCDSLVTDVTRYENGLAKNWKCSKCGKECLIMRAVDTNAKKKFKLKINPIDLVFLWLFICIGMYAVGGIYMIKNTKNYPIRIAEQEKEIKKLNKNLDNFMTVLKEHKKLRKFFKNNEGLFEWEERCN